MGNLKVWKVNVNKKKDLKPWNLGIRWGGGGKSESKPDYTNIKITNKGETVKSGAEKILADFFNKNNINYQYEKECFNDNLIEQKISNPDFYLPKYDVYVEYWGMINDEEYHRNMKWKMKQYHENNIKFISIYPHDLKDIERNFRRKFKELMDIELK